MTRHIIATSIIISCLTVLLTIPNAQPIHAEAAPAKSNDKSTNNSSFNKKQTEDIQNILKDYLLENPEIVREALIALEKKSAEQQKEKQKEILAKYRSELVDEKTSTSIGNPKGDVTIVEFFDYNCPYCRQAHSVLKQLLKEDANLKIVFREFPILGPASITAAKASLSAKKQGKYSKLQDALLAQEERLTEEIILKVAEKAGLDMKRLKADMASEDTEKTLQNAVGIGAELGLNGTPTFIIGDSIFPEMLSIEQFKELIAQERKKTK